MALQIHFHKKIIPALLAVFLCPAWASEDDSGSAEMLMKMQQAVSGINYYGTLVHMSPGRAELFRVYHRVAGQSSTERIVWMDGAGAEIIRNDDEVICIFPNKQSMVVEKREDKSIQQSPLRQSLPTYTDQLIEYYSIRMDGMDRIAERAASIIVIDPRDQYRYGYRLWLDKETAMPLKTQLVHEDIKMPLEEIRFTSISMPDSIPPEDVAPAIDTSSFAVIRHPKPPERKDENSGEIRWRADDAPAGFNLTMKRYEYMEGASKPRVHLVYSDGLASVSVFMDADVTESEKGGGLTVMGASNAYSVMKNGYMVTAMGEVPEQTVRQIALSMVSPE
ncbi:MAG: MucB/RseB C-terminal domain-containing protein [Gammaproteobacteria bacterium]